MPLIDGRPEKGQELEILGGKGMIKRRSAAGRSIRNNLK